jgi:hypothetical protein
MKIWSVLLVSWINKVTDTHPECVVLMTFPLRKWLGERGSMLLLCTYFCSCFPQFSLGLYLTIFHLYDRIWRHLTYLTVFDCICVGCIWLIDLYDLILTYLTAFVLAVFDCIWLNLGFFNVKRCGIYSNRKPLKGQAWTNYKKFSVTVLRLVHPAIKLSCRTTVCECLRL